MAQSQLFIPIAVVVLGAMFAASAGAPAASDSFFGNSTLFSKKAWRKRMIKLWGGITALTFLIAALGIGFIVLRTSIQPGDIGRTADMPGWSDREVSETMRLARRMITACYAYRDRYGRFPAELEDLSPHFLRNIEPPAVGHKRWTYSTYNRGQAFYLSFAANGRLYPAKSYASGRSPPWSDDD